MKGKYFAVDIPVYDSPGDYAMEILENLKYRQFTLKDAGITSRVHNNWRSLGIVPDSEEDGKKLYFDFIQYLWLQIVKDLRRFGLPLETIAAVKDYMFDEDFMAGVELDDDQRASFRKTFEEAAGRPITEEELEEVEENLKKRNTFYPYRFSLVVLNHFQHRSNTHLYVFPDGEWRSGAMRSRTQTLRASLTWTSPTSTSRWDTTSPSSSTTRRKPSSCPRSRS
ncbi:hypothetical protein GCM10028895_11880 [Pontibacter rugosus]